MPQEKKLDLTFRIYSHFDADGGIAAAIFGRFIHNRYAPYGWNVEIVPVNHVSVTGLEWFQTKIQWPCAILDFTLHPQLLSGRFFHKKEEYIRAGMKEEHIPPTYWIDHHPTGSSYPFLDAANAAQIMPHVTSIWDITAISTPGLLRTHHKTLGIPPSLLYDYEEFIDLAEIVDGALFATGQAAHDFQSPAVKLQTIFAPTHPAVDRYVLYKYAVQSIMKSPSVEGFFDSDPLYTAIVQHEEREHVRKLKAYKRVTKVKGKVAVCLFETNSEHVPMGRFLPYLLYPEVNYALHALPKGKGWYALSCGVNPWNKPVAPEKHIGRYFEKNFGGGGHAFVAGGQVQHDELRKLDELVSFLNEA